MKMRLLASLLLLAVQVSCKNPVSRVSRLLHQMQEKVSKQGQVESKLWEDMKDYCKANMESFGDEITRIEKRLPILQSELSLAAAQQVRLRADKDTAEKEKVDAQSTLNGAQALRQSESKEYDKARNDALRNIASIDKAIASWKSGGAASFLQTGDAELVRQLVATANLGVSDRDTLSAALMSEGNIEPSSSIAVGILQSMRDTMDEDQKAADRREAAAVASFLAMSRAKSAQIAALDGEIETKTTRIGELQVDMANKQADQDQSQETRSKNKQMLDDLTSSCNSQDKEWTSRSQMRAEEMQAIAETLEILSSQEARQVFDDQAGTAASPAPAPWMSLLQLRRAEASLASQKGNSPDDTVAMDPDEAFAVAPPPAPPPPTTEPPSTTPTTAPPPAPTPPSTTTSPPPAPPPPAPPPPAPPPPTTTFAPAPPLPLADIAPSAYQAPAPPPPPITTTLPSTTTTTTETTPSHEFANDPPAPPPAPPPTPPPPPPPPPFISPAPPPPDGASFLQVRRAKSSLASQAGNFGIDALASPNPSLHPPSPDPPPNPSHSSPAPHPPGMSFLQVRRVKASLASQGGNFGNDALALMALASHSGMVDFSQVTRKVDDMIQVLKREEDADAKKREWCIAEMQSSKDNLKTLGRDRDGLSTMMREVQDEIEKTAQDLKAITSYVKALDEKIDQATKNRKAENQHYKEAVLTNNKARELLLLAKDRLRRFYGTMDAAKHGVTLLARRQSAAARMAAATAAIASAGDGLRVASESAVELAPPSLVQMSLLQGRSSPKGFSAYQVQSESGKHILSMLDVIVADLDRDQKAFDSQEADAQAGYEKITKDAQELREEGALHAAQRSNVKASLQKRYETLDRKGVTTSDEKFGVDMYVAGLKRDCTFLLENFEDRKSARARQLESLGRSQKVLTEQR